ncbi:MAG: hypothetical protein ACP5NQ_07750, partial [Vulcanisaeta sp.]
MSEGFYEVGVNISLSKMLRNLGLDCRAEQVLHVSKHNKLYRPDIRCFHNGLIVGIEASYDMRDAEKDARARIDQGLVDLAIALHYPQKYRDVTDDQLNELIKNSRFNIKIIAPSHVKIQSLLDFINNQLGRKPVVTTDWFSTDVPTLVDIIRHA